MDPRNPTRFPLCWPDGHRRTPPGRRQRSQFSVTPGRSIDGILYEIERLGGRDSIISSDMPVRADGLPRAGRRLPEDPGVAVYWVQAGRSHAIACDRWDRWDANLRALNLTLESMRAIERYGSTEIMDRIFRGFQALPPAPDDWRAVLGIASGPVDRATVDRAFRHKARSAHPDNGGSQSEMVRLTGARAAALAELEGPRQLGQGRDPAAEWEPDDDES